MASLREIKGRIGSVNTTLKITSAMKMVASAKLHKAQRTIEKNLPYERCMHDILTELISAEGPVSGGLFEVRPVERVALVCFSSDLSLCGSFNTLIIKKVDEAIEEYANGNVSAVTVFSVGKKVEAAMKKRGFANGDSAVNLSETKSYTSSAALGKELADSFINGGYDKVELIYSHFKSVSSQPVVREVLLPFCSKDAACSGADNNKRSVDSKTVTDYILEPGKDRLLSKLIPQYLNHKLYSVLLDSAAAEFAARTVAMQTATDNGEDLLQELTLEYNKGRQQKITDELLDLVGGNLR